MISSNLIELDADFKSREEIIKHCAKLMNREEKLKDLDGYIKSVLDRENINPTCFDFGVAIPHGKSDCVKEACFAFTRLEEPIIWCPNGEMVNLIFQIAVPESEAGDTHLKILAKLARNLMHEEFRDILLNEKDKDKIYECLLSI